VDDWTLKLNKKSHQLLKRDKKKSRHLCEGKQEKKKEKKSRQKAPSYHCFDNNKTAPKLQSQTSWGWLYGSFSDDHVLPLPKKNATISLL